MEIYLIRHTTPVLSSGLIYGKLEVPLSPTFNDEVEIVRSKLPARFDKVFSSPSSRCTMLSKEIDADFQIDTRLTELDFGDWEGKTWNTVDQTALQIWMDDFVNVQVPGGESMMQMHGRVNEFRNDLLQMSYNKVGVITHAGVIRLMLAIIRKTPLDQLFQIQVDYGEVISCQLTRNA